MAKIYDRLGRGDDVPAVNRNAQPDTTRVQMSDWTVLSRIDGQKTIKQLIETLTMSESDVVASLRRLRDLKMITVGGKGLGRAGGAASTSSQSIRPPRVSRGNSPVRPARAAGVSSGAVQPVGRPKKEEKAPRKKASVRVPLPTNWPTPYEQFVFDPLELAQEVEIDLDKRKQIIYYHYHLQKVTYYDLFQLPQDADNKTVRRAYFKLSKEFHPDLYFRKELGPYKRRIEEVFQWFSKAYAIMGDPRKRAEYDGLLARGLLGQWQLSKGERVAPPSPASRPVRRAPSSRPAPRAAGSSAAHTPVKRRVENNIIRAARQAETAGQWQRAWALYQKQLQTMGFEPMTAHRAARCMLELEQGLSQAEAYCRKALGMSLAVEDRLDVMVTLAQILEVQGRTEDAKGL